MKIYNEQLANIKNLTDVENLNSWFEEIYEDGVLGESLRNLLNFL